MDTPLKGDYAVREITRYCRRHGVALARPLAAPPMNPLPAARAFAWLLQHAPGHARPFARAALRDYWEVGVDLGTSAAVCDSGTRAGVPATSMADATSHPDGAALLRSAVEAAMSRGVFGSPFFVVDGEPFFGVDKLELVDEWLASGGW
jgi:2-hydroxychromene-2-carboxylate isomerase